MAFQEMNFLFFAPIASCPTTHGGSIRTVRIFEELASGFKKSLLIGSNFTYKIDSTNKNIEKHKLSSRSKFEGALRSVCSNGHYLEHKQLTPDLKKQFVDKLKELEPIVVIMSYLYCASLVKYIPANVKVYIDTHNNDWEWFHNLKCNSSNPLFKLICNSSLKKTDLYLASLPTSVTLLHVSEADCVAYCKARPDLDHLIIPNGCDVDCRSTSPSYSNDKFQLLFVGSLSSQMNVDALVYFEKAFWPHLRDISNLKVVGSNPGDFVHKLCKKNSWILTPNVSNSELNSAYDKANFAIMPFKYGAGSKLKLAEACGHGVPVITTKSGVTGIDNPPSMVLIKDSGSGWLKAIKEFELQDSSIADALNFAHAHSWKSITSTLEKHFLYK